MSTPDDAGARESLLKILSALRDSRPARPASLTAAALAGDIRALQLFLDQGADIEQKTFGFASPLCAASAAGKLEAVRWLVDRGANVAPDDTPATPLFSAIRNGHLDVVDALVAAGARLEDATAGFLFACAKGLTRTVRGLVDQREQLAAALARQRGEEPIVQGPERDTKIDEALRIIQRADDRACVWTDEDGEGVLGLAARTGVGPIVEALLERGADPNHRAPVTGFSALHRAAECGHHDVVSRLLSRGADPNASAAGRVTPLMLAAQSGDRDIVAALVSARAAVRVKDVGNRRPADYASGPHATEIVEMLAPRRSGKPLLSKGTPGR